MAIDETTEPQLRALLPRFAAFPPPSDELQFTVELVIAAAEDAGDDDVEALTRGVAEALESVAFLDDARVPALVAAILAVLTGSPESSSSPEDEGGDSDLETRRQEWRDVMTHYAVGKDCLALLAVDGEWHPARVKGHFTRDGRPLSDSIDGGDVVDTNDAVEDMLIAVEFVGFGGSQRLPLADVVMDEDVADGDADGDDDDLTARGLCLMCERPMNLTAHHVIPRVTHAKYLRKGFTRAQLNTTIMICRQCHSKIHSTEDEKTLARDFNTLDKIVAHPEIARWIAYARKQKARVRPVKRSKWRVGT